MLKAHCRTWEDHLWALVSVACEERLSAGLAKIERECFWEGGLGALEHGAITTSDGQIPDPGDEESWEEDVLQTLGALSNVQVSDGYEDSSNVLHFSDAKSCITTKQCACRPSVSHFAVAHYPQPHG